MMRSIMLYALIVSAASAGAAPSGLAVPRWLTEADVCNGWYKKWTDDAIAKMRDIPFVVGVPLDKAIIEKAHKQGARALAYVTYYQFPPRVKYQNAEIGRHPDWIIIDKDGKEAPSIFANNPPPDNAPGWVALCPNSAPFRKYAVEYARFMMEQGIDGLFIDNGFEDHVNCHGPKFGRHKHVYPDKDNLFAYGELLKAVRAEVRKHGEDSVVIVNTCGPQTDWADGCDGQMLESYICTWVADHRLYGEKELMAYAKTWATLLNKGRVVLALSYLGHTKNPVREDAFYCYAWARLSGFLWCDWFTGGKDSATLYKLRLGSPKGPMVAHDGCYTREFERGMVAVSGDAGSARFSLPAKARARVHDVFEGKRLKPNQSGEFEIELAPGQGRVYLFD